VILQKKWKSRHSALGVLAQIKELDSELKVRIDRLRADIKGAVGTEGMKDKPIELI
jgi:hypothetical protein